MKCLLIALSVLFFISGCAPGVEFIETEKGVKFTSTGLPMFRFLPIGEYKYVNKETNKECYINMKADLKVVDFNILSKVAEGVQE